MNTNLSLKSSILGAFSLVSSALLQSAPSALAFDDITENAANEVLPKSNTSAEIRLPDGRDLRVHRSDQSGPQSLETPIYFHRPVFAFVSNTDANADHPVIWGKGEREDKIFIELRLLVSSRKVREWAETAVLEQDRDLKTAFPDVKENDIDVKKWPLKLLRLNATDSFTNEDYGHIRQEPLDSAGDVLRVYMEIPQEEYENFVKGLKSDTIVFSPSYTFENRVSAFAQSTTKVSTEISAAITKALESRRLKEGDPIFQKDALALRSEFSQNIDTQIRATDARILSQVTSTDLTNLIMDRKVLELSALNDPNLLDSVKGYLAPIVTNMHKNNETTDQKKDTTTNTDKEEATFNIGGKSTGVSVTLTDEDVRELETTHKVKLTESEDKSVIDVHAIEVQYVRSSWQRDSYNLINNYYLAVGSDSSFWPDTVFRASFTTDVLDKVVSQDVVIAPWSGVPDGTVSCGFYNEVPKGWIALDGQSEEKFPNRRWVPDHLRGKPLPDMSGQFVRGATAPETVGTEWRGSNIVIPEYKLSGSDLSLRKTGTAGVLNQTSGELALYFPRQKRNNPSSINGLTPKPNGQQEAVIRVAPVQKAEYLDPAARYPEYYYGGSRLGLYGEFPLKPVAISSTSLFDGSVVGGTYHPRADFGFNG